MIHILSDEEVRTLQAMPQPQLFADEPTVTATVNNIPAPELLLDNYIATHI